MGAADRASRRSAACLVVLASALAAGCPGGAGPVAGGPGTTPYGTDAGVEGPRAVVVFRAYLRTGPGSGPTFGELHPDTVVRLGDLRGGWQEVEVTSPLPARGWVRADRLGCRALARTPLSEGGEGTPEVELQPGALLAVLGRGEGGSLEVETRGPVGRRGRIDASRCGVGESFVPRLPRDGELHLVRRETALLALESGGGPIATLPVGYRFAVEGLDATGSYALGRTDGPVILRGRVDATALEEDPRGTPLDRLAEPLGYTHETVVDEELRASPSGRQVALLPGGTPLNVTERRGEWVRVRTVGHVELDGWVEHLEIRRVALDHNDLDPAARRRTHHPVDRDRPRALEVEDEDP